MRALLLVLTAATVMFGPPATALAQQKAVRLIAEAEDFRVERGPWEIIPYRENYYASTFAITFLSRMACLGAPEQVRPGQEAVASQRVRIPYAGQFEVLARYEQPYNFSAEFTVEVEQGGRTVYRQVFGRLQDPKIWGCCGPDPAARRRPMARFFWGGTDNIVWQHKGSVRLAAGEATIRLIAGPQMDGERPRRNAARRHVDLVCLTNDHAGMEAQKRHCRTYLEMDGWLVQDGDLYARFSVPQDAAGPALPVIAPNNGGQHSPYYVHLRDWPTAKVLRTGYVLSPTSYVNAGPRSEAVNPRNLAPRLDAALFQNPPRDQYLQPGDTSGWVPMGQVLDALNNCIWTINLPAGTGIEFGIPDGAGGVKPVRKLTVSGRTSFEIPGCVAPNPRLLAILKERWWTPVIRTQQEALEWLLAEVRKFPDAGPVPRRFLIYNIMGFGSGLQFAAGRELARELGDNTMVGQQGKKRQLVAHWRNPSVEWIKQQEARRPFDDLYIVSYGDEMHLPALRPTDEEFAAWLKARGVTVEGEVHYTENRNDPLYYYSRMCAKEKGARRYAAGTAYYKSKGVLTGTNYSPHANYLVTALDYILPFKLGALTMPWSEDYVWQIPEFSVQGVGYLVSGLRAGAKYHDLPIHMYVMPHSPGNTPRDFRLSFYTCVAHGAKMINYFCASPMAVGATENYVATDDLAMWRAIHDCSHEAGLFEDYVMDGHVRQAKVGLLLSSVDEVMTGVTNATFAMHNNERKAIYYALRHAQVPVDFLGEDDVVSGRARDYRLIYVTAQWLRSDVVKALQGWVRDGGTLVAMCGGGFLNEFNRDNPDAHTLYGVRAQKLMEDPNLRRYLIEPNRPFLSKQDLPPYEPFDTVTWRAGDAEVSAGVIVWKQSLTPSDGRVIGTFSDGSAAVVEKRHGAGRAVLFGFLPGQAYLKSGLPLRPVDRGSTNDAYTHFLPTDMDPALRRAIVDAFLPADFERPVTCSEQLVEATIIDTERPRRRMAVPLMNYTGHPIERLEVRVSGVGRVSGVRSVRQGRLRARIQDGALVVSLPLEVADMLLIDL